MIGILPMFSFACFGQPYTFMTFGHQDFDTQILLLGRPFSIKRVKLHTTIIFAHVSPYTWKLDCKSMYTC